MLAGPTFFSAGDMELSIDGSPRVIIPESSSAPVTIQSSLSVGGSSLVLGGSATALAVGGGGGDTLELNPASSFANGVLFHGETLISATLTHLTTPVLVSSSGSGVLPAGLFRVDGSIRGKKGYPTVGGPDPAFGYSFDEDSGTGLFAVEGEATSHPLLSARLVPCRSLVLLVSVGHYFTMYASLFGCLELGGWGLLVILSCRSSPSHMLLLLLLCAHYTTLCIPFLHIGGHVLPCVHIHLLHGHKTPFDTQCCC